MRSKKRRFGYIGGLRGGRPSFSSYLSSVPMPSVSPKASNVKKTNRFKNGKRNRMGRVSQETLDHLQKIKVGGGAVSKPFMGAPPRQIKNYNLQFSYADPSMFNYAPRYNNYPSMGIGFGGLGSFGGGFGGGYF